jgi:L-2,4-diaminobutyrate decarboxylase
MNPVLKQAYDAEIFRSMGKEVIDLLADYLASATAGQPMPVLPHCDPAEQLNRQENLLDRKIPFQEMLREVIRDSNHLHHPHYAGHQVSAPLPLTALCELTGTLLNNASAIYEMGPVSVAMERVVMKEMAAFLGFNEQADGFFTSGGTLGNLTALLAARQAKAPFDVWQEGMDRSRKLAFMVPADAHYSISRGLRIAGFGDDCIIPVPVSAGFKTEVRELESLYRQATAQGKQVIGLAANACSTAAGIYDDLDAMADFCASHELWFHVDGAHGVPAIFSKEHRHLLKGLERADSVVIDFHKMMNAPALLTLVLFRNSQDSFGTFSQSASYLFEKTADREWYNYSKRSMECTKRMMGLTVFSLWKYYGPEFFSAFVQHTYRLADEFAQHLKNCPDFELAVQPSSNIVCFRYRKSSLSEDDLNVLNRTIRKKILTDGSFYIVQTDLAGNSWLRITLMNPFTSMSDLEQLLELIRKLAAGS